MTVVLFLQLNSAPSFDLAFDQYSQSSSNDVYPAADEISTYKKLDAREGVVSESGENKFGVADVQDNNVYNYGKFSVISVAFLSIESLSWTGKRETLT